MMRVTNRLLTFLVGAGLAGAGLLVGIEAVWAWTGSGFLWIPGRRWLTSLETTRWSGSLVIAISVGVAVAGIVLLAVELRPHRRRVAEFRTDSGSWLLVRRSSEAHLSRRLSAAVPTSPIKVRLAPRPQSWRLKVTARAAASSRSTLETSARAELERLHAPGARVLVKTTGATSHD